MVRDDFFHRSEEQSKIKIRIVANFVDAWANIMSNRRHVSSIGYVDLYAGPGRYDDGTECTCLKVLENAIKRPRLQGMLKTLLNDQNPEYFRRLKDAVNSLPGIETLAFPPDIRKEDVAAGEFTKYFASIKAIPMFVFLDPWGIKGMTMELIASMTKDWGSDCAFFFNFSYIRRAIDNPMNQQHVVALFGQERAERVRTGIPGLCGRDQERLILGELEGALVDMGYPFIQTFRFYGNDAILSHHLVYLCKVQLGYEIMKDMMAPESTGTDRNQGVPNYEYHPIDAMHEPLFQLSHPFDKLMEDLPSRFSGRTLSVEQIYHAHNVGTPYIQKNYKQALLKLEQQGGITVDRPPASRNSGTIGDKREVAFPDLG